MVDTKLKLGFRNKMCPLSILSVFVVEGEVRFCHLD